MQILFLFIYLGFIFGQIFLEDFGFWILDFILFFTSVNFTKFLITIWFVGEEA